MSAGNSKKHRQGGAPRDTSSAKRRKDWNSLQEVFADIDEKRKDTRDVQDVFPEHITAFLSFAEESNLRNLLAQAADRKYASKPDLYEELVTRTQHKRDFHSIATSAKALTLSTEDEERIAKELQHFAEVHADTVITYFRAKDRGDPVEAIRTRRSELRENLLDETKVDKGKIKKELKEVRDVVDAFGFHVLTKAPLVFPVAMAPKGSKLPAAIKTFLSGVKKRNSVGSDDLNQLETLVVKSGTTIDNNLQERINRIKEMLLVKQQFRPRGLEPEEDVQWRRMEAVGKRITDLYKERDGLAKFESENEQLSNEEKTLIAMLKSVIAYRVHNWQRDAPAEGVSLNDILKEKILELEKDSPDVAQQKQRSYLDIELAFNLFASLVFFICTHEF